MPTTPGQGARRIALNAVAARMARHETMAAPSGRVRIARIAGAVAPTAGGDRNRTSAEGKPPSAPIRTAQTGGAEIAAVARDGGLVITEKGVQAMHEQMVVGEQRGEIRTTTRPRPRSDNRGVRRDDESIMLVDA